MKLRSLVVLSLLAPMALAKPTTQPATTQAKKYPTPNEVIAKMKAAKVAEKALPGVAYFDLSQGITESDQAFSLFGNDDATTLRSVIGRLHDAAQDNEIRAVLITLGMNEIPLAQAQELREALLDIKRADKRSFIYADSYDLGSYVLATGATDICLLNGGEVSVPGVGIETMFLKGLLDKIGLKADYVQIGEYKGADEELTRSNASDELKHELNKISDALYNQIVDAIFKGRKISRDDAQQMIDDAILSADVAKQRKLVDHLVDLNGLRDLISKELGVKKIKIEKDYGLEDQAMPDFSNPMALLQFLGQHNKEKVSDKDALGLVYVDGVIVDGDGGQSMFGGDSNAGSDDLRTALRTCERDKKIKAVVVRINSPGGSAIASEAIWQAVRHVSQEKPVIISVGSMAASGGYYIASSGDYIFADPGAIVGSIGVVGGKIVWKDLLDKLGVTSESFSRGRNADLYSWAQPWSEKQRSLVETSMKQTYTMFTQRVMTTRKGKIEDIDKVARGRVFLASQAKDLGMVDAIGGLESAMAFAADQANLKTGDYDVRVLPSPKTLADLLMRGGADSKTPVKLAEDSILRFLPRTASKMLQQEIMILHAMEKRGVVLAAPYSITIR